MRGAAKLVHMVEHGVADHEDSTALPGASSIASRSQTAAEVRVALLLCSVTATGVRCPSHNVVAAAGDGVLGCDAGQALLRDE